MANNYQSGSCRLMFPAEKCEQARVICERIISELKDDPEYWFGCNVEIDDDSIWFYEEESFNPETVATIAGTVIDELDLDENYHPFVFGWSYTCSKPRLDEFGGGACAIAKGKEPFWIDAYSTAAKHFHE